MPEGFRIGERGSAPRSTSRRRTRHGIYDYHLGGKDNYAADRAAADATLEAWPEFGFAARANRAFLSRVVRYLIAEAGIRQFLDLGTGIPTAGNLHEVAQSVAPESRVVYVDYDPIVLAHARALLDSDEAGATEYIDADLRDTGTILTQAAHVLDFSKPVAVTMLTILHVIPESDDPRAIVARLLAAVPSGSYLAISHASSDLFDPEPQSASRASWTACCSSSTHPATESRWNSSSQARTWLSQGLCRSRNGGRSPATTTRASPICGQQLPANGDAPPGAYRAARRSVATAAYPVTAGGPTTASVRRAG